MMSVHGKKKEFTNTPVISRKSIPEMFPLTRPGYTALLQQPNQGDLESSLASVSLSPESKQLGNLAVSIVEEPFFSEEFLNLSTAAEQLRVNQTKIKG